MTHGKHSNFCARITSITGLPESMARQIMARGITSLPDLELAAYDGRLESIPGVGKARVERVRHTLDRYLSRPPRAQPLVPRPDVATLLETDAEYRRLAADGVLPLVAPHRFNPERHAWLPVWHAERDGWTFTVMYSNTPRAYELGKRRDWVIIVYERDGEDDHCTVVTEHQGGLQGRRVIRGREDECRAHYYHHRVTPEVRTWIRGVRAELDSLGGY